MNLSVSSNLTPLSNCFPGSLSFLTSTDFQNKCNLERDKSQINSYYIFPISLNSNYFNINQCGICYEIVGNKGVIRARVEDLYTSSDFNVNNIKTINEGLNYVITEESNNKISFRMVACDYNTNIKIKLGTNNNNNSISFIVMNNNIGIKEIQLMEYGNPTWNQMTRNENNNYWEYNKSTGNFNFPLTIRIYSITDENVIINNINSLESNKEYESSNNFKITNNYYFVITDRNLNKIQTTTEFKNTKCCKLDTGSNTSTNNNINSNTNLIIYQNGKLNEDNFEFSTDKSEIIYNPDTTLKIKYNSNGQKAQFIIKTKQNAIKTSDYKGITFNMKYNQKCSSLCKLKFIIENKEEYEINIEESNINSMINYTYEFSTSISEINTLILDFFYFSFEAFELELNDIQLIANNKNDNSNTNNEGLCFNSSYDIISNVETYVPSGNSIKIKNIKIYDKEPKTLSIETEEFNLNNGQKIVLSLTPLDNSYKIDITNCTAYTSSQNNINSFKCHINNPIDDNIYNINSNSGNSINFNFDKNIQVKNGVIFIGNDNLLLSIFSNLNFSPIIIVHSKEEIVQKNQRIIFDIYPISISKYNGEPEEIIFVNENSNKSLILKSCEAYNVENNIIYHITCNVSNNILIGNYTTLRQNTNIFLLSGQSINITCNESNGGILTNRFDQTIILGNFTKTRHYNLSLNLNILYNSQNLNSGDDFPYKVNLLGNKKQNNIRRLQPYSEDYDTIITFKNCTLGNSVYENGVNTFENINCLFPDKVRAGTYNKIESDGLDSSPDNKNITIIFEKDYDRNALSNEGTIIRRYDDEDDDSSSDKSWIIWVILAVLLVLLVALIIMLYLKKRRAIGKSGANNDTTVVKKSSESIDKSKNTTSNEIK